MPEFLSPLFERNPMGMAIFIGSGLVRSQEEECSGAAQSCSCAGRLFRKYAQVWLDAVREVCDG